MSKSIQFATGVEQYDINGTVVEFNPTDYQFAERLVNVFDRMDALQQQFQGQMTAAKDNRKVFQACREIDAKMHQVIDDLFQNNVAAGIFRGCSCYALADGLPVWCNLILAIMDEVDATVVEETKATNPRLDAYLAKYKRADA